MPRRAPMVAVLMAHSSQMTAQTCSEGDKLERLPSSAAERCIDALCFALLSLYAALLTSRRRAIGRSVKVYRQVQVMLPYR